MNSSSRVVSGSCIMFAYVELDDHDSCTVLYDTIFLPHLILMSHHIFAIHIFSLVMCNMIQSIFIYLLLYYYIITSTMHILSLFRFHFYFSSVMCNMIPSIIMYLLLYHYIITSTMHILLIVVLFSFFHHSVICIHRRGGDLISAHAVVKSYTQDVFPACAT